MRPRLHRALVTCAALSLVAAGAVALTTVPASAATLVQVAATPAQTIQNIGASGAWWVNDLTRFSTANQQRVAQLLFSSSGIQLSAYRYNIGGGGVGVAATDRAPQTLLTSPGVYDWTRDPGGTAFLRYAAQNGVPDIVGFVNSAPAVWKDNSKSCGGHVRAGSEQAFATYLTDIVTHFNAEGVRINYVSPMNEPDNSFDGSPCGQEGMLVVPSQRDDIVLARERRRVQPGGPVPLRGSTVDEPGGHRAVRHEPGPSHVRLPERHRAGERGRAGPPVRQAHLVQ
jgi:O-glycosyl hydrolase